MSALLKSAINEIAEILQEQFFTGEFMRWSDCIEVSHMVVGVVQDTISNNTGKLMARGMPEAKSSALSIAVNTLGDY